MNANVPDGFVVIAEFKVKPGRVDEFLALALDDARRSVAEEPGCRTFDVTIDEANAETIVFYEVYDDRAAFDRHLETEHLARFRAGFPALVVDQRPVRFLARV